MNAKIFPTYVEQTLVPALPPGDIVLPRTRSWRRTGIEAVGASLRDPLAQGRLANHRWLWKTIGRFLDLFTLPRGRNYFAATRYEQQPFLRSRLLSRGLRRAPYYNLVISKKPHISRS